LEKLRQEKEAQESYLDVKFLREIEIKKNLSRL